MLGVSWAFLRKFDLGPEKLRVNQQPPAHHPLAMTWLGIKDNFMVRFTLVAYPVKERLGMLVGRIIGGYM